MICGMERQTSLWYMFHGHCIHLSGATQRFRRDLAEKKNLSAGREPLDVSITRGVQYSSISSMANPPLNLVCIEKNSILISFLCDSALASDIARKDLCLHLQN